MFGIIVVGVDGSDTAERALKMACELSKAHGSTLHLVYTPHPQTVAFATGAVAGYHAVTTMPDTAAVKAATDKVVAEARAVAKGHGVEIAETFTALGEPGDKIVMAAKEVNADLIVMGRRGLGALGALVQGSTSLRVNHLAECATLTVV